MSPSALAVAALVSVLAVGSTLRLALAMREGPALCPEGLERAEASCCGEGQLVIGGRCTGRAKRCAAGQILDSAGGCTRRSERIRIRGEVVPLAGGDWEGNRGARAGGRVQAFDIDSIEVTAERYASCVRAGKCTAASGGEAAGLPLAQVSVEQAQAFCEYSGGRLPTGGEWVLAAAGKEGRRYPWGSTGLVCRRAAFGLSRGPCATGGTRPDPPGSRPDGATPDGVHDLAGNLAEWTREPNGSVKARGGSFLSRGAAELKSWSAEERRAPAPDIGFRCVYPTAPAAPR